MQSLQIRNDSLVEIATFLARRWSEKENITVEFSDKSETKTLLRESRIILVPFEKLSGDDFQRYRQFRTALWYESMRVKLCKKILSNDHAFGFILNTIHPQIKNIDRVLLPFLLFHILCLAWVCNST